MITYADLLAYLTTPALPDPWADLVFNPGLDEDNLPPGRCALLTPIGGPGLNTENLFDGRGWQITVLGEQRNYSDAEALANELDRRMLIFTSGLLGSTWVTSIVRQGSPPTPLIVDDADRHRFTCSYVIDAASNVA